MAKSNLSCDDIFNYLSKIMTFPGGCTHICLNLHKGSFPEVTCTYNLKEDGSFVIEDGKVEEFTKKYILVEAE